MGGMELTSAERRLATQNASERTDRLASVERLLESLAAAEARTMAAVSHESKDRQAAMQVSEDQRAKSDDLLRYGARLHIGGTRLHIFYFR
jgi:hypothetical protein